MPVRRYRWKDAADDAPLKFGVVAQEVEPLFPESVGRMVKPGDTEESWTVKYGTFGLIAVKALQELKTEKDAEQAVLKKELADLKQEVALLKSRLTKTARVEAMEEELSGLKEMVMRLAERTEQSPGRNGGDSPLPTQPTRTVSAQPEIEAAR